MEGRLGARWMIAKHRRDHKTGNVKEGYRYAQDKWQ
jgi:hypothetical protein